jgi:hypothetical protein
MTTKESLKKAQEILDQGVTETGRAMELTLLGMIAEAIDAARTAGMPSDEEIEKAALVRYPGTLDDLKRQAYINGARAFGRTSALVFPSEEDIREIARRKCTYWNSYYAGDRLREPEFDVNRYEAMLDFWDRVKVRLKPEEKK